MFLFSQILSAPIKDKGGKIVGRFCDIYLIPQKPYPIASCILVKQGRKKKKLDISFIGTFSPYEIRVNTVEKKLEFKEKHKGKSFSAKEILDKQIVDTKDIRVVRANDLQFSSIHGKYALVGIAVSSTALLRRLGFPGLRNAPGKYINWPEVSLTGGKRGQLRLAKDSGELQKLHPSDLADIIEDLKVKQGSELLESLDDQKAARVFEEVEDKMQVEMMESLGPAKMKEVIEKMSVDEVVDFLKNLVSRDDVEKILHMISDQKEDKVRKLLKFKDEQAGGLMDTEFLALQMDATVSKAIEEVEKVSNKYHTLTHLYVVNKGGRLIGVVSMRRLLVSDDGLALRKIMKKPLATVDIKEKLEEISVLMARYNLVSMAVVDKYKRILGVIYFDDVIGALVEEY